MKKVDLILSAYSLLKKVLETTLEGTECAKLCFKSSDSHRAPFSIVAMDALMVSQGCTEFNRPCFERYQCDEDHEISIDVKELHDFVRNCKGSKRIRFTCEDLVIKVHEMSGTHEKTLKPRRNDNTAYLQLDLLHYRDWPNFEMSATEFSNIVLDLAVGGSEMSVSIDTNSNVKFHTNFESGKIDIDVPTDVLLSHRAPEKTCVTSTFIVKFMKLLCSITYIVRSVTVFVSKQRLVMEMNDTNSQMRHLFTIRPYEGPRGVKVPKPYIKYALREN